MKVKDVMNRDIQMIGRQETLQAAAQLMAELDTRALPVGSAGRVEGILTDRDIIIRAVAEGRDVATTRVEAVMSSSLFACHPDATCDEVRQEMVERQVRRMPVLDDGGQVVGLVTEDDLGAGRNGDASRP
ncbi:MAG TPA: CBS domain-containing protein [Azospirillaceae bacterium]|nr:CBS domain-containing protein [Azospirillaceae bacterium]